MIDKLCRFTVLAFTALGLCGLAFGLWLLSGCASVDRALYNVETNWTPHVFVQTNIITVTNTVPVPVLVIATNTFTLTNSAGVVTAVIQTNVYNLTNQATVVTFQTNVFSVTNQAASTQLVDRPATENALSGAAGAIGGMWGLGGLASTGILGLLHFYRNIRNKQLNSAFVQAIQTSRELLATTQGEQAKAAYTNWLIQHQTTSGVISAVAKMVPDLVDNPAAREAAQFIAEQLPAAPGLVAAGLPVAPTSPAH